MACTIPVKIDLSKNINESGIHELLQHVKPTWTENIEIKALLGGFINQSWLCSHQGDKLVVRVNPSPERIPFVDRDYEAVAVEYLDSKQLVPKFLGRFHNGLVYQYANGVNPSPEDMENEDVMKLIIDKLYRIHTAGVPKKSTYSEKQNSSVFYHYIDEVVKGVDESKFDEDIRGKFESVFPSSDHLREEAAVCRGNMDRMYTSFPHVFCHQDLWRMNVVYDESKQKVEILDWETGDYAPAPQDLGCLVESYNEERTWRKWIKLYFNRAGLVEDERVMDAWYTCMLHTMSMMYLGCCCWGLWNITLTQDKQEQLKLIDFAIDRYTDYKKIKSRGHQDTNK